jgi:hypothetical protein
MKRFAVLAMVVVFLFSTTAFAAVNSKTTSDLTSVVKTEVTGVAPAEFAVVVVAMEFEPEAVTKELEKIFQFVTPEVAPVSYFPEEVQEVFAEKLPLVDLTTYELNEFISIDVVNFEDTIESAVVEFKFTTQYVENQSILFVVGLYTGEVDENGEYIVEWLLLDAVVTEDGSIAVTFTQEALARMADAAAVSVAVLSEPLPEEEPIEQPIGE